jgi:hypothetical protein
MLSLVCALAPNGLIVPAFEQIVSVLVRRAGLWQGAAVACVGEPTAVL